MQLDIIDYIEDTLNLSIGRYLGDGNNSIVFELISENNIIPSIDKAIKITVGSSNIKNHANIIGYESEHLCTIFKEQKVFLSSEYIKDINRKEIQIVSPKRGITEDTEIIIEDIYISTVFMEKLISNDDISNQIDHFLTELARKGDFYMKKNALPVNYYDFLSESPYITNRDMMNLYQSLDNTESGEIKSSLKERADFIDIFKIGIFEQKILNIIDEVNRRVGTWNDIHGRNFMTTEKLSIKAIDYYETIKNTQN